MRSPMAPAKKNEAAKKGTSKKVTPKTVTKKQRAKTTKPTCTHWLRDKNGVCGNSRNADSTEYCTTHLHESSHKMTPTITLDL
jgi:CCCH zinc finger in TRM13 protein